SRAFSGVMIGISRSIFKNEPQASVPSDGSVELSPRHGCTKTKKKQYNLNFIIWWYEVIKTQNFRGGPLFVPVAGIVVSVVRGHRSGPPDTMTSGRPYIRAGFFIACASGCRSSAR